jgi:hypothetical protein
LGLQDAADVRHAREGAQAEYYRQFSFRPAINPRSRQLAQARATIGHQRWGDVILQLSLRVVQLTSKVDARQESPASMAERHMLTVFCELRC